MLHYCTVAAAPALEGTSCPGSQYTCLRGSNLIARNRFFAGQHTGPRSTYQTTGLKRNGTSPMNAG